jgi:hypothetical protein
MGIEMEKETKPTYVGVARVPMSATAAYEQVQQPSPPARSRPLIWFMVVASSAVVLLAVGVLFGWALRSPGMQPSTPVPAAAKPSAKPSPSPKRDSPQQVTQRYLDALAKGDNATSNAELCGLLHGKEPGDIKLPFSLGDLLGFEVTQGSVNGRTATVDATVSVPILGSTKFAVYLLDEHGAWKVCGFGPA